MNGKIKVDWKTMVLIIGVIVAVLIGMSVISGVDAFTFMSVDSNLVQSKLVYFSDAVRDFVAAIPDLVRSLS